MYQKNLKSYYNRHYGKGKAVVDRGPRSWQNKKMLEEDSEDEYTSSKMDKESFAKEQKFASIMFLLTIVILLAKLYKLASTSFTTTPSQWLPTAKFPELKMDWYQGGDTKLISPVLWGFVVAAMTWIVIYFDSKVPGVNPGIPTRKQLLNPSEWSFAYWTSLCCGFFVFLTMIVLDL